MRTGLALGIALALGAGALPGPGARPASARVVEKIVAVVGDEIILQSEVEEAAKPFMADIAALPDAAQRKARAAALRKEVLDRLIDEQLIQQQADDLKVNVTSEEIDRSIDMVKQQNNMNDAQLAEALRAYGMTMAAYRQRTKKDITRHKVLGMAVGARASVSDADVQSHYDKHFKTGSNVQVRASHVFIGIPEGADAAAVREREQQAKKVLSRARAGEDFAALARELSEDSATRAQGGDLGFFGRDMGLPRAVEELVFSLEPGQVGGPVRGDRGFHVMKVLERRSAPVKSLAEVKNEIRRQLHEKEMERQTKSYLAELRKRTLVDVRM